MSKLPVMDIRFMKFDTEHEVPALCLISVDDIDGCFFNAMRINVKKPGFVPNSFLLIHVEHIIVFAKRPERPHTRQHSADRVNFVGNFSFVTSVVFQCHKKPDFHKTYF